MASRTGRRSANNINAVDRQPASLRSRRINGLRPGWQPSGHKKSPASREASGAATIKRGLKVQPLTTRTPWRPSRYG